MRLHNGGYCLIVVTAPPNLDKFSCLLPGFSHGSLCPVNSGDVPSFGPYCIIQELSYHRLLVVLLSGRLPFSSLFILSGPVHHAFHFPHRPGDFSVSISSPPLARLTNMSTKLDLTDLNKFFDKPASYAPPGQTPQDRAWLQQFYARVHYTEAMNSKQVMFDHSPSSSNATLVEEDNLMDHFKVCKIEEPFFAVPDMDTDFEQDERFVEEMNKMTNLRKSLSINTNLSFTPSPIPSPSPASSIPSSGINPFAKPFVPSYPPRLTTSRPIGPSDIVWFSAFWTGVSSSDPEAHKSYSADLVNSTQWTTESMGELAQHFCWKGADWTTDVSTVAPFARAVHDHFRDTYDNLHANCLSRHIREIVVSHFKACWKSVSSSRRSFVKSDSTFSPIQPLGNH